MTSKTRQSNEPSSPEGDLPAGADGWVRRSERKTSPASPNGDSPAETDDAEPAETAGGVFARLAILFVLGYRKLISPMLPASCRYQPTCSQYTLTALRRYGFFRGMWLGIKRILRCHPFHSGGHDPVP